MMRSTLAVTFVCSLVTAGCERSAEEELKKAEEVQATAAERSAEAQKEAAEDIAGAQEEAAEAMQRAAEEKAAIGAKTQEEMEDVQKDTQKIGARANEETAKVDRKAREKLESARSSEAEARAEANQDIAEAQAKAGEVKREAQGNVAETREELREWADKEVAEIDLAILDVSSKKETVPETERANFEEAMREVQAKRAAVRRDLARLGSQRPSELPKFDKSVRTELDELRTRVEKLRDTL